MYREADDIIKSGSGKDVITGLGGNDIIISGDGNDNIVADNRDIDFVSSDYDGNDTVFSGGGDDIVVTQGGNDIVYGGSGNDTIYGDYSSERYSYIFGNDYLDGGEGDDSIWGGGGDDTIDGGSGNDKIYGEEGNDLIYGRAGDDILRAANGDDTLYGGDGNDVLYGDDANLNHQGTFTGNDYLYGGDGSDSMYGGKGNDYLHGGEGKDFLYGGEGDDYLYGGDGVDVLEGNKGTNYLTGGRGKDYFRLDTNQMGVDIITDFGDEDLIVTQTKNFRIKFNRLNDDLVIVPYDMLPNDLEGQKKIDFIKNLSIKTVVKNFYRLSQNSTGLVYGHSVAEIIGDNDKPVISEQLTNISAVENTPFSFTLPQSLFSDPDGDLLRMNVVMADGSALPNWLRYHSDTRTLSGTPSFDDAGSLNLQVVATDSSGLSAVQDWRIDVNNSNRAPNATGALNTQTLKAGQAWSYVVPVNNHFSDPDGDHLNYRITLADGSPLPSWLQYDAASHTLRGTPTHVQQVNLKILASDTEQAEAFLPLTLQIDAATQPVVPPFRPQDPNKNLNGSRGHDHLLGGSGKDILRGFSGNDTLTGGKGNDRLEGGLGNDTYIFNKGDGRDQILDQAGKDTLRLQGLQVDQLWFKREGNKLKVQVIGTQDELSVENHYAFGTPPIRVGHRLPVWGRNRFGAMIPPAKGAGQIETFRLDNGRSLSAAQADKLIQAMAAFRPQQGSHLSVPEQMQQYLQQINVSSYWK